MAKILRKKELEPLTPATETEPETSPGAQAAETPETAGKEGAHRFEMLRREVDRLFDEFGPSNWRLPFRRGLSFELPGPRREHFPHTPAIDMVETPDGYTLTVEVPGLTEKDVEVKMSGHHLSIRGEKTEEKVEETDTYYMSERSYGSFHRSFRLPEGADESGITAEMAKGVLKVIVPKTADAKKGEKTIKIKAA